MTATIASIVLALIAAFLFACGSAAQQVEAAGVVEGSPLMAQLIRRPRWWLGLAGDLGGYAFQAAALVVGAVLVVQPLIVASLLFVLPLSALLNHTRVTRTEWVYASVLVVALAAFLIAGRPTEGAADADGATWLPALVMVGIATAVTTGIGMVRSLPPAMRALSFGTATGLLFGVATVLTKPVLTSYEHADFLANSVRLLTDWRLYLLVAGGLGAMYLQQRAFQPAPISASLPAIVLAEPVCAAVLGAAVLGETVTLTGVRGVVVIAAAAIGAVAAVRLAREVTAYLRSMKDFAAWDRARLTYPEVGATAPGRTPPADAHVVRAERPIGRGEADFAAARERILGYGMQRGAGIRVRASTPSAQVGTVIVLGAPFLGPITIACRVVYVLDEPHRAGFAYGTLPGHPESGEELFSVELRPDGAVVAVITAFSRPGRWYTRLGAPLGRLLQSVVTRRYLAAMTR